MAGSGREELEKLSKDELVELVLQLRGGSKEIPRKRGRMRVDRPFCMEKYPQRMIALKMSYLGWMFNGFAVQPTLSNTVEDHLFAALMKTRLISSRESADYSRAGRTDKGVSAVGQVIGIRVRSQVEPASGKLDELDYVRVLNRILPDGIRILAWSPAPDRVLGRDRPFTARFDAQWRMYRYYFVLGALDIDAMRDGAASFVGDHDFRNFCKVDAVNVENFRRVMYGVDVRPVDNRSEGVREPRCLWYIEVRGQAFLWHQVRCMVAILFCIGRGLEKPSIVARMLHPSGDLFNHKPSYQMASEMPLVFHTCRYPPGLLDFRCSTRAFDDLGSELIGSWSHLTIQRSIVDDLTTIAGESGTSSSQDCSSLPTRISWGTHCGRAESYVPLENRSRERSLEERQQAVSAKRKAVEPLLVAASEEANNS